MIDLRSDLIGPRTAAVAQAMAAAALRAPAMDYGEDADEQALADALTTELGVEAVLLVPTCTMANQIAIRLHLPEGGCLAAAPLSHIVTVESPATVLTGVRVYGLSADTRVAQIANPHAFLMDNGHPSPESVKKFLAQRTSTERTLIWLENTHMLSAGSVLPAGWQARIAAICRDAGSPLHLDGSRLWNAAVAQGVPMAGLVEGCDTTAISLNKALGAPLGAVLVGSRAHIDAAVRLRQALSGEWRPIGAIAAAAVAALHGWRGRLEIDAVMTDALAAAIAEALGEAAVYPAPTNLIFLNRERWDAPRFVEALQRRGVRSTLVSPGIVRLAIHNGIRTVEVAAIARAVLAADAELATA